MKCKKTALMLAVISLIMIGCIGNKKVYKVGIPADTIPVVSPELNLRINYKLTRELGLTVPESMMELALEIIRE